MFAWTSHHELSDPDLPHGAAPIRRQHSADTAVPAIRNTVVILLGGAITRRPNRLRPHCVDGPISVKDSTTIGVPSAARQPLTAPTTAPQPINLTPE